MEVYKITCKVNNKIYIGSTLYDKEKRWSNFGYCSHLREAKRGKRSPFYDDIRKYGKDNFVLETLEIIDGDRNEGYKREDFWIKKYWDMYGENMIYNQFKGSHGNKNWSVPHNPEYQKKAAKIRCEKYGNSNACMITKEAMKKAKETKIKKYGNAGPNLNFEARQKQRNKVSNDILDKKNNMILIGSQGVLEQLLNENYNVKLWEVKDLLYKRTSDKTLLKHFNNDKEILNRFEILGKHNKLHEA